MGVIQRIERETFASGLPWQTPLVYTADSAQPQSGRSHLANASSWHFYQALIGFDVDLPEGVLVLAPNLPSSMKTLSAPILSPTFTAWMDYRPTRRRTLLSFRLDRYVPAAREPVRLQTGVGLTLKKAVIPSQGEGIPQVFASIGRAPIPGKVERDARGRLVFIFENPIKLTAGQRLEFIVR
jgi:hypothetical protein